MKKEVITYDLSCLDNDDCKLIYLAIEYLKCKHDIILDDKEMMDFLGLSCDRYDIAIELLFELGVIVYDHKRSKYDTVAVMLS